MPIGVAPKLLDPIQRDSAALGLSLHIDEEAGGLLRALTATKPGGFVLQMGSGCCAMTAWLADGADITTQVITLVEDGKRAALADKYFADALNITVHRQTPLAFLQDVSANRFNLICIDELPDDAVIKTALDLLAPAGIFFVIDPAGSPQRAKLHNLFDATQLFQTAEFAGVIIAARRARAAPVRRRSTRQRHVG